MPAFTWGKPEKCWACGHTDFEGIHNWSLLLYLALGACLLPVVYPLYWFKRELRENWYCAACKKIQLPD